MAKSDFPDLWSDDADMALRAASPFSVTDARRNSLSLGRSRAQALHDAGLLAKKPVDPPT